MRFTAILGPAVTLALALVLPSFPAQAQPQLISVSPPDGAVLAEPPSHIQLCFAEPVDNADDADFLFRLIKPDGHGLGLRIVFQPDGLGVDVQPGLPKAPPQGEWSFEWRVTDAVTKEPASGTVRFQVMAGGSPISSDPPSLCTGAEATPAPPESTQDEDGGWNILPIVLIIVAAAGGAAAVGLILLIRQRAVLRSQANLPRPEDENGAQS